MHVLASWQLPVLVVAEALLAVAVAEAVSVVVEPAVSVVALEFGLGSAGRLLVAVVAAVAGVVEPQRAAHSEDFVAVAVVVGLVGLDWYQLVRLHLLASSVVLTVAVAFGGQLSSTFKSLQRICESSG